MKKIDLFLILFIISVVASVLYFSRQIFFYRYEPEYYENYYYNSQWNVPQSTRGISDGELYKFVGYRLAQGENPFNINYEAPPFAKYLYGLSEMFFGNPYWVSIGFYLLGAVGIYFLSLELFGNFRSALLGVLLFVTTPFMATQIKETMLDLPLTSLFLMNSLFFVRYLKKLKTSDLIISGIFLGLATGTKIGIYTPFLLILGLLVSIIASKKLYSPLIYLISSVSGYVVSFYCYFSRHPNPLPWLRLHQKPLDFYLQSSGGNVDYLNQWRGIFMNSYQGFWEGAKGTGLGDWSLVLPLGVMISLLIFWYAIKKKSLSWVYLTLFSFVILAVNTLVPFWARYLMPAVPLFLLFTLFFFRRFIFLIIILSALNLNILYPTLTRSDLQGHTKAVERFINTRAYRELYRSIDNETRKKYPEVKFQKILENFYSLLKVRRINSTIDDNKMTVVYETNSGKLSHIQEITSKIEHNQWKTIWNWDYLWPGFNPDDKLEVEKILPTRITGKRMAVYVIPRLMYDWGKYSSALTSLTRLGNQAVDAKVRETIPDDFPRFVGFLDPGVDPDTINKNLLPGIELREE